MGVWCSVPRKTESLATIMRIRNLISQRCSLHRRAIAFAAARFSGPDPIMVRLYFERAATAWAWALARPNYNDSDLADAQHARLSD